MKAPKQMRKPSNWQDFETLCKKLWGEIWNCPEIKKNGRQGQAQHGVDVYGIPKGESEYYGIQCKGKSDYVNSSLTLKEVEEEISKAEQFEPPLKKFYFTTTASKDAELEKQVRQVNIDRIQNRKFEVHLYSWEDIVDLIEENRCTFQWYVNSENFKDQYDVVFCFDNNETSIEYDVPVDEVTTLYVYKEPQVIANKVDSDKPNFLNQFNQGLFESLVSLPSFGTTKYNASFAALYLCLDNIGNIPIKHYKVIIEVEGDCAEIDKDVPRGLLMSGKYKPTTFISRDFQRIEIEPQRDVLVSGDYVYTEKIMFFPRKLNQVNHIILKWKLLSESYSKMGELDLSLKPSYIKITQKEFVDKPELEKTVTEYRMHEVSGSIF